MAGQSNIFVKPETLDPFGPSTDDFKGGIFQGKEKRPNIDQTARKASQAAWEKSINGPQNKLR